MGTSQTKKQKMSFSSVYKRRFLIITVVFQYI